VLSFEYSNDGASWTPLEHGKHFNTNVEEQNVT